MMSKVSFFKLLKEDMKRRSWLLALISVIFLVAQPIWVLFSVEGLMDSVKNGQMNLLEVQNKYMELVGVNQSRIHILLILIIAALIGITGYSYLHSRIQQDFYQSLPVSRKKWFLVQFTSGLLIMLMPYAVCTLLSLLVGVFNGIMRMGVFAEVIRNFMVNVLGFLVVYLNTILAMVMTGKIVVGIMGILTFLFYGPGVFYVLTGLFNRFFTTYMDVGMFSNWTYITSPAGLWLKVVEKWQAYHQEAPRAWLFLGLLVVCVILLLIICIWLYIRRPAEAAEQSMAFAGTENVIRILVTIPLSLLAGLMLSTISIHKPELWFFVGIILGVILVNSIIEFIYHIDIRELFRHKLQLVFTIIGAVMIGCVLQFDWLGYDSYLPAKEEIAQMACYSYKVNGSFAYNVTSTNFISYDEQSGLDRTAIPDFDPIYEMSVNGVKNARVRSDEGFYLAVKYVLRNGRDIYRRYRVDEEVLDKCGEELFAGEEYKKKTYPIYQKELSEIRGISLNTVKRQERLELTADQKKDLLEVYKMELLNSNYNDFYKENIVSELSLEMSLESNYDNWYEDYGYPVSVNFTETIKLLNEYGYSTDKTVNIDDIAQIKIYYYDKNENLSYSSQQDIEELMDALCINSFSGYGGDDQYENNIGAEICLEDGSVIGGIFKKGDVPSFVGGEE